MPQAFFANNTAAGASAAIQIGLQQLEANADWYSAYGSELSAFSSSA